MSSKRAGESSSCEKAKKMPKLLHFALEKATVSQIQELEQALDDEDDHHYILRLAQEIAKTPDLPSSLTMRLLEYCVQVESESIVGQLLAHQTIDLNNDEGGELLWCAVNADNVKISALLMEHGANLSVRKHHDNRTLLHNVIRGEWKESREKIVKLLLDHGADANACDSEGHTPLRTLLTSYFSYCDDATKWIQVLLNYGVPITWNEDDRFDDICLVCDRKPELLIRFIEHQNPDEQTRNRKGVIAIEYLISKQYVGAKLTAAVQLIKQILDLGVPVRIHDANEIVRGKPHKSSFLCLALWLKNEKAVKLLLDYGADPRSTIISGYTPLYQATAFKGSTYVSRMLIEKGATIYDRNYNGGYYPIHGAYENESLRNIHLLLNLDSDLNFTRKYINSAFQCMKMKKESSIKEAHLLVIKHLALVIAKGGKVSKENKAKIQQFVKSYSHFAKCEKELERMKEEKIYRKVSYFSLLSRNMKSMVQLMKNQNFVRSFKEDEKKQASLFPEYFYILSNCVEVAKKRLEMLLAEKKELQGAFEEFLPDHIIENITFYYSYEKIQHCQHDFYINLHATLKKTKADKVKIM